MASIFNNTIKPANFSNPLTQDPFNWKFPTKDKTMYLQTINKEDVGFNTYTICKENSLNAFQDIISLLKRRK